MLQLYEVKDDGRVTVLIVAEFAKDEVKISPLEQLPLLVKIANRGSSEGKKRSVRYKILT